MKQLKPHWSDALLAKARKAGRLPSTPVIREKQ